MTIARGIVERHGGRIWAESTGRAGEGSTFHVVLPREPLATSGEESGRSRQHLAGPEAAASAAP